MNLNGTLIGSENPQRLRASGATVVREPYQPGEPGAQESWIARFADPDNNYFQLMSPM